MNKRPFLFKYFLLGCLLLSILNTLQAVEDTLYIYRDTISVNGLNISSCSFNDSPQFSLQNAIIKLSPGETLDLTVVNNDSKPHSFIVDKHNLTNNEISAGDSKVFQLTFNDPGTFRYYSDETYGRMIGGSGIIAVGFVGEANFYWNLFDSEAQLSHNFSDETASELPPDFQPDLFFINGYTFPNTLTDTTGYVQGQVGEEIIISIVNSGNMEHVLHFHGYHVEILSANINTRYIGWVKDSFPLKCGEAMTVKMIPDKEGEYPVHDHNLIAVTNAGFYPGGMITFLNIQP